MPRRFWPRSLIVRILLAELGAIAIVAMLLPAIMVWLLHQQMNRYEVETLTAQAAQIAQALDLRDGRPQVKLAPDLAHTYATAYDGRAYVIADRSGHAQAASAFAALVPWQKAPREARPAAFRSGTLVGISRPLAGGFWIVVMQDEAGPGAILDDVIAAFVTRYGPVLLLILLLLPLVNSLLIRHLVVEVRAVSGQARTIGPKTLDLRLAESGLPLEVAPLAQATNALLVRLQQSFQQQSEFVANVAHELRTPLTALKFQLEAVEDDAVREPLGATVDRLGHVIAQLQALAALEVKAASFEPFDLARLAREVIAELAPQIIANGDTVMLEAPDAPVTIVANRTLIALALSNLVANATRHTPPGTEIRVRIVAHAIEVADNGPGIAGSDPGRARQRYWRADNARSDSAGLGLSIVARIMEVHEGGFGVESRPGEGARFLLTLPKS